MRIDLAAADIARASDTIMALLGDDEDTRAYLDMMEGETDLHSIVGRLLNSIEDDEGDKAALAEQITAREERKARVAARINAKRAGILKLMEAAKLDKLPLPEATVSVRDTSPKLSINDPIAVPDEYTVVVRKPSLDAIKAAFPIGGDLPNWLRCDPARPSLIIRRR